MTTSIQDLDAPLAFRLPASTMRPLSHAGTESPEAALRVEARALDGMQKEALVGDAAASSLWRLVCDEGHYLHGTDLAPPPLAFFSAGMASLFAGALSGELAAANASVLRLEQDAYYRMEGSVLRGTMRAFADAVELRVHGVGGDESLQSRLGAAIDNSLPGGIMATELRNTFAVIRDGVAIDTGRLPSSAAKSTGDPAAAFERVDYSRRLPGGVAAVSKLESAASVFEEDHGAGAALKEQQKRQLLIRSRLDPAADGLHEVRVQIHRPIGSVFRFLVDPGDSGRAPDGMAYLSAGVAFCYMTQLGRYIQIAKKNVDNYRIVQTTRFGGRTAKPRPVDTQVYFDTTENDDDCRTIAAMGEQTCFLHAACRMSNSTELTVLPDDTAGETV